MIDHNEVQFIQFTTGEDRGDLFDDRKGKIFLIMTQSFNFILSGKKATEVALFRSQCHLNLFGDVSDQVQNFVGVTGFVVVPDTSFTKLSFRAIPALASNTEVQTSPLKSVDTTSSSV